MARRKKTNKLASALEKFQIQEEDIYTLREDEGNLTIITRDGRRFLYHTTGPVSSHRNYHQIYSEIANHV